MSSQSEGVGMRNSIIGLVLLLAATGAGLAQDRGTIRGIVTDQSGGAIPTATVTLRNVNTGLLQTVRTEADGVYVVPYLPAGDYTATTEKAGFQKSEVTGVEVHVATVSNIDVTLHVSGVEQ